MPACDPLLVFAQMAEEIHASEMWQSAAQGQSRGANFDVTCFQTQGERQFLAFAFEQERQRGRIGASCDGAHTGRIQVEADQAGSPTLRHGYQP